jgi:hypothetical protein
VSIVLLENPERREHAQHPVQGRLVCRGRRGQLVGASRPIRQEIGDSQLGGGVHAAGDVDPELRLSHGHRLAQGVRAGTIVVFAWLRRI